MLVQNLPCTTTFSIARYNLSHYNFQQELMPLPLLFKASVYSDVELLLYHQNTFKKVSHHCIVLVFWKINLHWQQRRTIMVKKNETTRQQLIKLVCSLQVTAISHMGNILEHLLLHFSTIMSRNPFNNSHTICFNYLTIPFMFGSKITWK